MKEFFSMIDHRYQTKDPLHYKAVIVLTPLADCPFGIFPSRKPKTVVTQNLTVFTPGIANISKILVVNFSTFLTPINHLALWVDKPAQFDPYNPAMIGQPFFPDLRVTTPFSNGVNEFNPVTINDAFGLWVGQKIDTQRLVFHQKAFQAATFGQGWKQGLPITFKPAIERSKMNPFEAEKHLNSNYFTRMQLSIFTFVDLTQFIVYHTKEPSNYFFGSHRFSLFLVKCF